MADPSIIQYPNNGITSSACSPDAYSIPNGLPNVEYVPISWNTEVTSCFAVAQLHITVGVVLCQNSQATLIATSVLECEDTSTSIIADPLAEYSLSAVAETASSLWGMNVTASWNYDDDPAVHVQNMLKLTYQGMWSATTNLLSGVEFAPAAINDQVPAVFARVSTWRVIFWTVMNILLTMASIILWRIQSGCVRATTEDPVLTCKLHALQSRTTRC